MYDLAILDLFAKVEKDLTVHGRRKFYSVVEKFFVTVWVLVLLRTRAGNPMVADLIISDAIIIDWTGIYKADIGIRDGKILAIGKGGNPDVMDNVDFIVGASTEAISGEGMIVTAGGIDLHVHYMTPDLSQAALDNGITTLFGGGTGTANGTRSATCNPGAWYTHRMLQAVDNEPVNYGLMAKGFW